MSDRISRSEIISLIAGLPLAVAATTAIAGAADAKASPQSVQYVTHPVDGKQCSGCSLYLPAKKNPATANGACKAVSGVISPKGYCVAYQPKAK